MRSLFYQAGHIERNILPWRFADDAHVLHYLPWELGKQFLGKEISAHLHIPKWHELHDVSWGHYSFAAIKAIISVQTIHVAEISISYSDDDD